MGEVGDLGKVAVGGDTLPDEVVGVGQRDGEAIDAEEGEGGVVVGLESHEGESHHA